MDSSGVHPQANRFRTTIPAPLGADATARITLPLPQPSNHIAWHYTDAAGLVGIAESGVFWASSASSLNDPNELKYGRSVFEEALKVHEKSGTLSEREQSRLSQAITESALEKASETIFLLSACKGEDVLNQWQHYAGVGGYALELDVHDSTWGKPPEIRPPAVYPEPPAFSFRGWYEVTYDRKEQLSLASRMLTIMKQWTPEEDARAADIGNALASMRGLALTLACCMKNPVFAVEQEVRYVAVTYDKSEVQFRAADFSVVPYLPVEWGKPKPYDSSNEVWPQPASTIRSVRLGPGVLADAKRSVQRLLDKNVAPHRLLENTPRPESLVSVSSIALR
jgi:hypothetical protein